ncbi:MAG: DUF1194 domain-containing protein [bacterium]
MLRVIPILIACLMAAPAAACETALLLAIDVSGSISMDEYYLQMNGLADALEDPDIVKALIEGQDALALVQWSGDRFQQLSLPWQHLRSTDQAAAFADAVRSTKRPPDFTDTAIGNAILFSLVQFPAAPRCVRTVIDLSGDGEENDGMTLPKARVAAEQAGIILNGLAIEIDANHSQLTEYFRTRVISYDGFVMTARGIQDYPRAIQAKLLRELTKALY